MLRFHPVAWSVIGGTFLSRCVFFMVYPYLAIYLSQVKGLDPMTIGIILGASPLLGTVSSFLGGMWSDRWGRYPVMMLAISLQAAAFIGLATADAWWMFLLLNACNGFFRNVFEPSARALLSDTASKEQSLSVFAARYYAINLAAGVGPLLGVYFGSSASTTPFLVTALVYGLYGVALVLLRLRYGSGRTAVQNAEPVGMKQAVKVIAADKFFRYFLIGNLFIYAAFSHLETTLSQYFGNHPELPTGAGVKLIATLMLTNALSVVLLQAPVTRLARRYAPLTCVKAGAVFYAIALLGFGCFTSLVPLILCVALFAVAEVCSIVVADVVIDHHAPEQLRGTYFGASGFAFLGQSAGPWLGGLLLETLGYTQSTLMFALLGGLTLLALPFFGWGERSVQKAAKEPAARDKAAVL